MNTRNWLRTVPLAAALVLALAGAPAAQAEPLPNRVPGTWSLKLNEEFSANGLNHSLWTPEWTGELMNGQCTLPSNVQQPGDGYLHLQLKLVSANCHGKNFGVTGSAVESNPGDGVSGHSGFTYSYGYVEWRAYVFGWGGPEQGCPRGGCIPDWPALWSFPTDRKSELDTMEGLHGEACFHFWQHVEPEYQKGGCAPTTTSYAGWHTFGLDWEPTASGESLLRYYYDGAPVWEQTTSAVKSTPQYLIMDEVPPTDAKGEWVGGEYVAPDEILVDYARVWQHPVAPTPTTSAATQISSTSATLNGTVDPNGFDTHYYFEYGTVGYEHQIPLAPGTDIGSGTSAVPVSTTVTGLQPGTTYKYRLVASNAGGGSEAEQTFTTVPDVRPAVVRDPSDNYQWSYYVGEDHNIWARIYNPSENKWSAFAAGGGEPAGGISSLAVAWDQSSNMQWVYYAGADGNIWSRFYNPSENKWTTSTAGSGEAAAPGSSPTVIRDATSNMQWVYYAGADGNIWSRFYGSPTWTAFTAGVGENW